LTEKAEMVWGDFACFTRPEMKVERFSYPFITPLAARGIFDAIYWKRSFGFYWQVEKIEILSPRLCLPEVQRAVRPRQNFGFFILVSSSFGFFFLTYYSLFCIFNPSQSEFLSKFCYDPVIEE